MWNHLYNFGILLIGYPFLIYLYFKLALNPPKDVDRAPDDIPNIYQFANHLTEENFRHTEANRWCPTCLVRLPPTPHTSGWPSPGMDYLADTRKNLNE